jgi:hypothetical protein
MIEGKHGLTRYNTGLPLRGMQSRVGSSTLSSACNTKNAAEAEVECGCVAIQAAPVEATVGRNEAGVIAQCANSKLTETHPTTVEQCRTLARILDNQDLQNMHPATSRQLDCLLKSLDSPKRKMKSHLATVSAMAGRRHVQ